MTPAPCRGTESERRGGRSVLERPTVALDGNGITRNPRTGATIARMLIAIWGGPRYEGWAHVRSGDPIVVEAETQVDRAERAG